MSEGHSNLLIFGLRRLVAAFFFKIGDKTRGLPTKDIWKSTAMTSHRTPNIRVNRLFGQRNGPTQFLGDECRVCLRTATMNESGSNSTIIALSLTEFTGCHDGPDKRMNAGKPPGMAANEVIRSGGPANSWHSDSGSLCKFCACRSVGDCGSVDNNSSLTRRME